MRYATDVGKAVADDRGELLPIESTVSFPSWRPDEDFVWEVIEAITGLAHQDEQMLVVHQL